MTALTNNNYLEETIQYWKHIAPIIHEPQNDDDYEKLARMLDQLLDIVGGDESHELIGLVDVISYMIARYDENHGEQPQKGSGVNALKFLMQQHGLDQSDLKNEIGSQGVVSEILNGKRQLNISHIKKLAERFHVTPATFID
ncbi:helix-turn-helix domain-containing protein [Legionella sp. D16C41]|uniref:helix-turn-helix domain-containing protein n=1 Tax=Legionella sp. D16C41 TaxID=3402688 RepID=UPI003AF81F1E